MAELNLSTSLIGGSILNLVTTGTYNNPLAIYREYIQNAADAADDFGSEKRGKVEIEIDPVGMRVRIRDDGPGLSEDEALRALVPIARSEKRRGTARGFRGIGRLSGLTFAETVTFLTRAHSGQLVSRIVWDGPRLRENILKKQQIDRALRNSVIAETIPGEGYPDHFFEVEAAGVGRHAAGMVLNRNAVRAYIAEVCPVPFSKLFPFAVEVDELLNGRAVPLTLDIILDGEMTPVTRQHVDAVHFSGIRKDNFLEFEKLWIPSVDGSGSAAVGWIAHTSYLGAVPREAGVRGIRARVGNIQVGDETVFENLFSEERFNRWCIGEVHILDPRIIPNGRWDYFEPGPHIRNLENHLAAALHGIPARCRKASSVRNGGRKALADIQRIEETYELAASGYLAAADAKAMIERAASGVPAIRRRLSAVGEHGETRIQDLQELESKLKNFRAKSGRPPFGSMSKQEIKVCRKVFYALTRATESPRVAKETIETVLAHS